MASSDDDEVVGFSRPDSRALLSVIAAGGGSRPVPSAERVPSEGLIAIAQSPSGGIPIATSTTPGSATCTFYEIDDSGNYAATSYTDTVFNMAQDGAVGANKKLVVAREYISNRWLVIWELC